jgi:uncharacterized protein (TIGR00730 family)
MANIAVYCGSSAGSDEAYRQMAHRLGAEIAAAGHRLVYGGGHVGLMGAVADEVMARGGEVTGVITEQLDSLEVAHTELSLLEIERTMHSRKARMAELADGVIVLPGGFGTLDEAFEILTWNQLGIVALPVVFLDVGDYFASLFDFLEGVVAGGFMKPEHGRMAQRTVDAADAVVRATSAPTEYTPKWVD